MPEVPEAIEPNSDDVDDFGQAALAWLQARARLRAIPFSLPELPEMEGPPIRFSRSPLFMALEQVKEDEYEQQKAAKAARRYFPGLSLSQGLPFDRMPRSSRRSRRGHR